MYFIVAVRNISLNVILLLSLLCFFLLAVPVGFRSLFAVFLRSGSRPCTGLTSQFIELIWHFVAYDLQFVTT